jgi:hypothetical protein
MKKPWIILTLATISLLGANFAHAATISTGVQTVGGTITAWSATVNSSCGGNNATWLEINGAVVNGTTTVHGGNCTSETAGASSLSIPFNSGDDIEIGNFPYGYINYYSITGDTYSTTTPSISFWIPSASSTAEFSKWELLGSNLFTDGRIYRFDVVYSQLGGATTYDDFNIANNTFSPALFEIPKSNLFSNGEAWYAQGFLFDTSSTDPTLAITDPGSAIATTSVMFFNIGAISTSTPTSTPPIVSVCPTAPPIFQLTGSLPYFTINDPIPSIISGGCNIMMSAFEMDDAQNADINTRYNNAEDIVSVKPPLGYFTLITVAFGSFASGSSSISLLPTASSTAALSPIFTPLDEGLAACVGLLGAFWLLRRLKHIQP